jgi:hypothetical protein
VREIRTLRAMWRALETELRSLLNGHEEGNLGHKPRRDLRATAPALDPTRYRVPSAWPEERGLSTFQRWFEYSFHSTIIDLGDDPIQHEQV